jgi:hypothetical protein
LRRQEKIYMKKIIASSILLAMGALGMGCGGTTVAPNNATNKPTATPAATPAATTPSNSNTNSDTKAADTTKSEIGVASCDEYLAEIDKYLANPKVPEAVRTAQKDAKEKYLTAWKAAASTPQGKAGLETGCKAALESVKALPKM